MRTTLQRTGRYVGLVLSPASYSDYRRLARSAFTSRKFAFWMSIAFMFCFILNGMNACLVGTLAPPGLFPSGVCSADQSSGDVANRLYYGRDYWNLLLYGLVDPVYVALDIRLILIWVRYWNHLQAFVVAPLPDAQARSRLLRRQSSFGAKVAGTVVAAMTLTSAFIVAYIHQIMDARIRPDYWFIDVVGGRARSLNQAGSYYLLMNAALLFLTFVAFACAVSVLFSTMAAGRSILRPDMAVEERHLRSLRQFKRIVIRIANDVVVTLKMLVLMYALNILVWARSPLGDIANATVSIVALTAINFVLVPLPRIYLEDRIHALGLPTSVIDADTRSLPTKLASKAIDFAIILILGVCSTIILGFNLLEPTGPVKTMLENCLKGTCAR